jgi:RNA polymerase sigma-70 factor, ECF subfamily
LISILGVNSLYRFLIPKFSLLAQSPDIIKLKHGSFISEHCNFSTQPSYITIEEPLGDDVSENEALWIKKAFQGDEQAFGSLIDHYQKPVYCLCYRMLGNSKDAEDAAQESFIRAYLHLKKYDPNRPFATWLLSIAAHYCIDQIRKRRLHTVSIEALPAEVIEDRNIPNPEAELHQTERDTLVQNLMMGLRPIDRAAVVLQYWHNYSEIEIANALNLTVSAVKSRLYRSRQALAKSWLDMEKESIPNERRPHESPAF